MCITGHIFNIQPFSVHDGPGLRTTVFLKGCNLRCFWCHNPEAQTRTPTLMRYAHKCIGCGACAKVCPFASDGKSAIFTDRCDLCAACAETCYAEAIEIKGYEISADTLFSKIRKDSRLLRQTGGGVTFSGGEPLLQPDFLREILSLCKNAGIHTAIETALCVEWDIVGKVLPFCDLVLCDLKTTDAEAHKRATGADNQLILENIKKLAKTETAFIVRTPVVSGFNDTVEDIATIGEFMLTLTRVPEYELLPFHDICGGKYESLRRDYAAKALREPSEKDILALSAIYEKVTGKKTVNQVKMERERL